ncbi:MAG TPA: hypothetical protein P5026_09445 [Kiritimatiellia bacterium]|nr:hypothetical protein [Kiritimatiellia bacterium]HRU70842.1 hypothetical protein [Kiritimatiellia bacterium]
MTSVWALLCGYLAAGMLAIVCAEPSRLTVETLPAARREAAAARDALQ